MTSPRAPFPLLALLVPTHSAPTRTGHGVDDQVAVGVGMAVAAGCLEGKGASHVLLVCDRLEMIGPYACPVAAQVVELQAIRDSTNGQLVGNDVGLRPAPLKCDLAITGPLVDRAQPRPAASTGTVDPAPERVGCVTRRHGSDYSGSWRPSDLDQIAAVLR